MYEVDELERLIREELDECISFDDYTSIDDFGDALIDYEDGIKDDLLCNNDFNWYGESGRQALVDSMCYMGCTYENLVTAITDENVAIDLIFTSIYDDVCNEFTEEFVKYLHEQNAAL